MRTSLTTISGAAIVLAMTASSLFAQAQSRFKDVAINATFVQSPRYQVSGVNQIISDEQWLEITTDYVTALVPAGPSHEWLDNVSFEYEVLLPRDEDAKNGYVLINGTVEYWSIALDGKKHKALAHIHPRFLQRYAPELKMRHSSLKNLYVKITFKASGAIVGGGFYSPKGKTAQDANAMFQRAATSTALIRVNNGVFSRDQTPWRFINPEEEELIKQGGK